jgi:hypothetical protein
VNGNPHYDGATTNVGSWDSFKIAQAVLAIAYEQRTANLIAMMQLTAGEWSEAGARPIAQEISERLGL